MFAAGIISWAGKETTILRRVCRQLGSTITSPGFPHLPISGISISICLTKLIWLALISRPGLQLLLDSIGIWTARSGVLPVGLWEHCRPIKVPGLCFGFLLTGGMEAA